jgi:hypothetical protein
MEFMMFVQQQGQGGFELTKLFQEGWRIDRVAAIIQGAASHGASVHASIKLPGEAHYLLTRGEEHASQ